MMRKLLFCACTLVPALALMTLARCSEAFARFIADAVSLPAGAMLNRLASLTPVPVGEALFLLLAVLFLAAVARAGARAVRGRTLEPVKRLGANLLMSAGAILLCFALLWYPLLHGPTLFAQLGYPEGQKYSLSELTSLCYDLTDEVNALSEQQGKTAYTQDETLQGAQKALQAVTAIPLAPAMAKSARYPELFRALGIAGIYCPFTGEAIVNPNELDIAIPYLITHESAHQCGYAREDEANYIAYLACLEGDARFQYSGTMYALYYAMEALHDSDTVSWTNARQRMNQAVQRDYYRMNGLRNAQEPAFVKLRNDAQEAFLRISRQAKPRSYGDMVDLLLAERRTEGN